MKEKRVKSGGDVGLEVKLVTEQWWWWLANIRELMFRRMMAEDAKCGGIGNTVMVTHGNGCGRRTGDSKFIAAVKQ